MKKIPPLLLFSALLIALAGLLAIVPGFRFSIILCFAFAALLVALVGLLVHILLIRLRRTALLAVGLPALLLVAGLRLVCLGLIRLRLPGLALPVLLLIARGRGRLLISARLLRILARRIGLRGILPGLLAPLGRVSVRRLAVVHP